MTDKKEHLSIPRIVIAGTQSGVGKTTLTAGLIRHWRDQGLVVQPFKVGPDYIDPGFHSQAAGRTAHNLDSWLVNPEQIPKLFSAACEGADIAVIEGVMGLFDGGQDGRSSTAEIARLLDAPIVLVHDCKSAGESAAAAILGFYQYDERIAPAGVILNRLGSENHGKMITEPLAKRDILVFGQVARQDNLGREERHLGLVPVEASDPEEVILASAQVAEQNLDARALLVLARNAKPLILPEEIALVKEFAGVRIGVAQDEAFSFRYPASLSVLTELGAELIEFSPINDDKLPDHLDGLFFGGGFPELHLPKLAANQGMLESIRTFHQSNRPIWAECGGFLYLCRTLSDFTGKQYPLVGLIPAHTEMTKKLQAVGYVTATARQNNLLLLEGKSLRGHHFHFSQIIPETTDFPWAFSLKSRRGEELDGYAKGNLLASYVHIHLLGNVEAGKRFLDHCQTVKIEHRKQV